MIYDYKVHSQAQFNFRIIDYKLNFVFDVVSAGIRFIIHFVVICCALHIDEHNSYYVQIIPCLKTTFEFTTVNKNATCMCTEIPEI